MNSKLHIRHPVLLILVTHFLLNRLISILETKIAGKNSNNLRYADETTLMAESEEKLKSLLLKVKVESEKLA